MTNRRVPEVVIRRLPKYYSKLLELEQEGVVRISSLQLSQQMGLNASQIRQDLNYFGGFGQQGYGYMVESLKSSIAEILGLFEGKNMVIVGCGNIGTALARYSDFRKSGFNVMMMFDCNPELWGTDIEGIQIAGVDKLEPFCQSLHIDIGVICTPKDQAQQIADIFVRCGVDGIWNFAPVDIRAEDTVVEDVRLSDSLYVLNYKIDNHVLD